MENSERDYRSQYKLWAAVLQKAILDLNSKNQSEKKEAFLFIKSDNPDFPSFITICELFGFDVYILRKGIFDKRLNKKDFRIGYTTACFECGKRFDKRLMKIFDGNLFICNKCREHF